MNTTFLWPTLAILVVMTIWQTAYNLRRFSQGRQRPPRRPLLALAFGCVAQWGAIAGLAVLGYATAGIVGGIAALLAMLVLPMAATFVIAAATGRIRRI
ncbi:MAG: hypothetical protein ACT4QD_11415 [Acidobacteriota bacterium]